MIVFILMQSVEVADIYATHDPMAAFHSRVSFCLDLHNQVPPQTAP